MDKDYDVLFRIMILGDTGVGKTCLLHRFCDEEFRYNHVCTIGLLPFIVHKSHCLERFLIDTFGNIIYHLKTHVLCF